MRIFLLFIGLSCLSANAQQGKLDSLWGVWNDPQQADTNKLKAMHNISWAGYLFKQPDSAFYFAQMQCDLAEIKGEKKHMADALNTQGISFAIRGDYPKAIEYFSKGLKIYEEIGEKEGLASIINNMGLIYKNQGDYPKAIECHSKSQKIYEEIEDKDGIASSYNNIGNIYSDQGEYIKAIECLSKSLKIYEGIGEKQGIGLGYQNIGGVYSDQGDYAKAIGYYSKSLKIFEEIGKKNEVATLINNIGSIYYYQGDYTKAIEYYSKSLKIREEMGDKNGIAGSLNNIGNVYKKQGDYNKALECYSKSLKIYEEIGNKNGIAAALSGNGKICQVQAQNTKAIEFYSKMLKIYEETGNKKGIAISLGNIGNVYKNQGDFSKAKECYSKSLKIHEEIGNKHGTANALNSIGLIYYFLGDYAKAKESSSRSLFIAKEIGSAEETREACRLLLRINMVLDSSNEGSEAANLLRVLRLNDLQLNFSTLSEHQKEMYFFTIQEDFNLLYDFSMHYPLFTDYAEYSFNNALITKGLLLKSSTAMRNAILSSGDSILTEKYNSWLVLKRRIAKAYSDGGDISNMEEEANELEKELVRGSKEFSNMKKVQSLSWKEVQAGLEDGESAIEFIRFTHQEDYMNESNKVQLYAALIVDNKCKHPTMIRLFEEPELEKILGTFPGNNLSYIQQVYGTKDNTKSHLYNLIWKPMEEALGDAEKVYVSPVGLLHKISFAALAKEQDVFLCDLYDIEMKSSTGKIALPDNVASNENTTTTLFGGIDYNSDSTSTEIWNYLDGSLSETQQISKILKKGKVDYNYFNQSNATEEQFKEIASKSNILHIATHGFFYPDPDLAKEDFVDKEESEEPISFRGGRQGVGVNTFVKSRNPLMRSGLAFAGANDVWNRTNIDGEDGVLTAAEVATIDMRNSDLVVLSACETGLGDIKGSEGVYGLQRSFKMAGVKYLIMSLWQVPDKETAEFMTTFYKYLTKTNDIKSSFNQTQKDMRTKYDPYYWAAFVLIE